MDEEDWKRIKRFSDGRGGCKEAVLTCAQRLSQPKVWSSAVEDANGDGDHIRVLLRAITRCWRMKSRLPATTRAVLDAALPKCASVVLPALSQMSSNDEESKIVAQLLARFDDAKSCLHPFSGAEDFISSCIQGRLSLDRDILQKPFSSTEAYFSVQATLLAEDFVDQLRESHNALLAGHSRQSLPGLRPWGAMTLFRRVEDYIHGRIGYLQSKETGRFSRMDWSSSKLLLAGSAVILFDPRHKQAFWCIVRARKSEFMSQGRVGVSCLQCEQLAQLEEGRSYLMFECEAYLEAYKHVLDFHLRAEKLPLSELILSRGREAFRILKDPSEIECAGESVRRACQGKECDNLTAKEVYQELVKKSSEMKESKATAEDLSRRKQIFSENQGQAFLAALSREMCLIQGPPGCAKSYIGRAIVSAAISDSSTCGNAPVLVVCFTNLALDSFLENMLPVTKKIIRLGSRSESTKLESHTLSELKMFAREGKMRDRDFIEGEQVLYKARNEIVADVQADVGEICLRTERLSGRIEELQSVEWSALVGKADIVGVTSTGAAKHRALLEGLGVKFTFMEEAGLMLEAVFTAAIPSTCQQLVLVGDHKQLRPTVNSYRLAKDYSSDVSLFERLIRNGFPHERLRRQYRMRPEISRLITELFYKDLEDDERVRRLPDVSGMKSNVFFLEHRFSEDDDVNSVTNSRSSVVEADFLLRLAAHLVYQSTPKEKITVLATYAGQVALIRQKVQREYQHLQGLVVSTVDNFQGQENDVILISLVRGGGDGIGYLNESARLCVALSRARRGLFIVGNLSGLASKSPMWSKLESLLKETRSVSSALTLKCTLHPESILEVSAGREWPERWCSRECSEVLSCGHVCREKCHMEDRAHSGTFACKEVCGKKCRREGHPCPKACSAQCGRCPVPVTVTFDCGHEDVVPCGEADWATCKIQCIEILPCGHTCKRPCHVDENHNVKCEEPCLKMRVGCERKHRCRRLCWQQCEPCEEIVSALLPCGHQAEVTCTTNLDDFLCGEKCERERECGHRCKSYCHECREDGCPPCQQVEEKTLICGHKVKGRCSELSEAECERACEKILPCGHPCPRKCGEPCGGCKVPVKSSTSRGSFFCDHGGTVPCGQKGREDVAENECDTDCREPCKAVLPCGHTCESTCGECVGGRLHRPCKLACERRLVCGHACPSACGEPCPPCNKKCLLRPCRHEEAACGAKCGDEKCVVVCKVSKSNA